MLALIDLVINRHAVCQAQCAGRSVKLRFDYVCPRNVAPLSLSLTSGSDAPETTLLDVQEGGKNGRTIKPRPAKPIQRAMLGNQSCRTAVADDSVIANWRSNITAVMHPLTCDSGTHNWGCKATAHVVYANGGRRLSCAITSLQRPDSRLEVRPSPKRLREPGLPPSWPWCHRPDCRPRPLESRVRHQQ